jgi:glycosyltransferase involved in cell wall biosynthesis
VSHRYGLDVLLDAVDRARREVPVSLTVHGQGEYLAELRGQAQRLGLDRVVTFSDRMLPTAELVPLLRDADVGVVPNRNDIFTNEILPTKLLEYVATGLPAIVARTAAIERYFDQTMVRFFRPGDARDLADAIAELYADPAARQSLAASASAFAEQHSWQVMAKRYVALLPASQPGLAG